MTSFENLTKSQKLRASLHRDVMAICKETCHLIGMEMTKPAMEVIAELVHKKITVYGQDLEAFAKHSKRSTINAEDVKLLARRNPTLKAHLNSILGNQPSSSSKEKKKRKTNTGTSAANETPNAQKSKKEVELEKPAEKEKDNLMEDALDNVVLSDTIDLTFD